MAPNVDERIELLLTLRVWVAGEKGIEHRALVDSLRPWLSNRMTAPEVGETVGGRIASMTGRRELTAAGPRRSRLGGAGIERIRLACGYTQRPRGWVQAQAGPLIVLALAVQGASADERRRLASADGLRAEVLRRHHDLELERAPSLAMVKNALMRSALGSAFGVAPSGRARDAFATGAVVRYVLSRLADSATELKPERALALLAARAVGASKPAAADLRRALVQAWLGGESAHPGSGRTLQPRPVTGGKSTGRDTIDARPVERAARPGRIEDLEAFAETVLTSGSSVQEGRFGPRRVFLESLWRQWSQDESGAAVGRAEFERALLEAHGAGHLTLSRADLVEAMDPELVARSALRGAASTFHFLKLPLVLK